jgi:hypothetical protein
MVDSAAGWVREASQWLIGHGLSQHYAVADTGRLARRGSAAGSVAVELCAHGAPRQLDVQPAAARRHSGDPPLPG